MSLTKNNVIELFMDRFGFTKNKSLAVFDALLEIIKHSLESGDDVLVSNFGKFHVSEKNERKGRNPATGASIPLRSRRIVRFKASQTLRDKINGRNKT